MSPKKYVLLVFFCFISYAISAQQILVDNTVPVQNLIENNLIQGCVEVSNISSPINGNVNGLGSFGYFDSGSSNFPFQNGIVLTTGNAMAGGNGQNTTGLNDGNDTWTTDPDLENALGISGTLNATAIEFDFISSSNQIQFNYILASEEYFSNFPCDYSDGFAFLIREAGTGNPYTNIALIPGTSIPVNTNTIHDEIVGFCDEENSQYFDGYNIGDTNYNGRTTVLSANAVIQPNIAYQIKLVIADQTDENYDSAVFIEGNSFNATVDLGEDIMTCASDVLLNADITNPQANYAWYYNDTLITGETQPIIYINNTGNYRVEISIPLAGGNCMIEDDINVTLSSTQSSDPIIDYELCDDVSNDGIESFELSTKDAEVLASVPNSNYNISYHYSSSDAENGTNGISGTIQNTTNPQTIFVRIEDIDNGCLAFSNFDLVVNALPAITDPSPLQVCDDQSADGYTTIDLSVKDDEITNGSTTLLVNYHSNAADAATGSNALPLPYVNTNVNEQLFVSVVNPQTGCLSTTTLDIEVLENPVINTEDLYIDACDTDHDGFANFDLTVAIPEILQGLTGVSVSFHESNADALSETNAIADESNYANTIVDEQIIYVRVEDNTSGCASVAPLEIHTNLLLTATNINDATLCDIDNDGVEEFHFSGIATGIINDLENVTVVFYETEDDRDNQVNAIDQGVPYIAQSNPQTIYLALQSDTCADEAEIDLILLPIQEFDAIENQTVCNEDQDGYTTTDLSQFDVLVTQGQSGYNVTYFASESDAQSNTNPLPNFYDNTINPYTVYTRIQSVGTGCFDINSFDINVLEAPVTSTPSDIIICDDDLDGFSIIDLQSSISEVVSDTTNRTITFYNSQADAENATNQINNESTYNSETELIYIRVENTLTGCFSTEILSVLINTLPVFDNISNYRICEDNSDGFGNFIFETKDTEILNGQTGKRVLYYANEVDADSRNNAIDKTSAYTNTSNPQTIYVRIENISDADCYDTSSFTIEVGSNPEFNVPTDWFVCDDLQNDGSETFDFSTKIAEMSQGITEPLNITFYTSQFNAENSINPLPLQFQNTVNPQQIYVQIDNGTICNSITSFELNVVQVPEAIEPQPFVQCDTNYDGIMEFDLTVAEFEILDVRQDNIEITYFETLADLDANTNVISSPEAYANISNPQTVFIKVTNTISNCYVSVPMELVVNLPPAINPIVTYDICATQNNNFNLTEINEALMDESFNVLFTYFTNEVDARTNTNALNSEYTYQSNNDTLFVRVEFSTTHCFIVHEFNLNVNTLPIANQPNDLVACDDDDDGMLEFELSQQTTSILGGQDPNLFSVSYHNSEIQALEDNSPLPINYLSENNEIIYARVENDATGCYEITQFTTIIHPLPNVFIEDQVICLDNLPLFVSANTNNMADLYEWSTGETSPEIEITEIGTYWVTITNEFGCEITSTFNVSESEAATIEITETVDFSDPNNITVTISGIGNYLYQLDDNEPQESNIFENVGLGYHTVTIIDLNGCSEVTREVLVIDVPKHMSPNNDGAFDTWHISGVETLPGTVIYIFDRYGKLLKQIGSNTSGWDGTYNGKTMPAGDYWFLAEVHNGSETFEVKGHFALRR